MTNILPQRTNVNNTIELINKSLDVTEIELSLFNKLSGDASIEQELEETINLQQKSRSYRKNKLHTSPDIPLKTGPMRILRFQLKTLEEELAEHQLLLKQQK